jgi:hypothetical protein
MRLAIKQKVARGQSVGRGIHVGPEQGSIHLIRSALLIRIGLVVKVMRLIPQERVAAIILPSSPLILLRLKLYLPQSFLVNLMLP